MPAVIESSHWDQITFREWPVFKTVRGERTFQEAFKKAFGEEFILGRTLSVKEPEAQSDAEIEDTSSANPKRRRRRKDQNSTVH